MRGLLALLDMDVVELHPRGSTVDHIEHPDDFVFDLDPGAGIEWDFVTQTTLALCKALQSKGFHPWVKTRGAKGCM
jgi:bifunctional non-homologous end joining protein LigD